MTTLKIIYKSSSSRACGIVDEGVSKSVLVSFRDRSVLVDKLWISRALSTASKL